MGSKKKAIIITGVVVVGLIAGVGMLGGKDNSVKLAGDPTGKLINVGTATAQDIQTRISSTGMVFAKESERLLSEINTKIESIAVEIGDQVKKGDVLMTFDQETKDNLERELKSLELRLETARLNLSQSQNASTSQVMQVEQAVLGAEQARIKAEDDVKKFDTNYALANTQFDTASKQYEATKELFSQGLASKQQFDQAESGYLQAQDAVNSLQTQKTLLEKSLEAANKQYESTTYERDVLLNSVSDKTKAERIQMQQNEITALELQKENIFEQLEKAALTLVAPMDGIVATISAKEGLPVAVGAELIKIIDPTNLVVKAEVSPYYAAQLEEGLSAQIKYNGSTTIETTGIVSVVSPIAVQKQSQAQTTVTTAIPIEVKLDNVIGLKEGLTVDLKIVTEDVKDVIAVPLLATMQDDENNNYLYVVNESTLEKRYVKQGAANNQVVQVSDIELGEIVVTNPTEALEEGMSVSYLPLEEEGETK